MFLFDSYLKLSNSRERPDLMQQPSFLRAQEALETLLKSQVTLAGLSASGWMPFFQLTNLRQAAQRRGGVGLAESLSSNLELISRDCLEVPEPQSLGGKLLEAVQATASVTSQGYTATLRMLLSGGAEGAMPRCGLARGALVLSLAYASGQHPVMPEEAVHALVPGAAPGPGAETQGLQLMGDDWVRQELRKASSLALPMLLLSPWPVVEALELLSHPGRIEITVADAVQSLLGISSHPLLARALSPTETRPRSYLFRVNPYREMVSDMVRYSRLPFCGLMPFMRMVLDVAKTAMEAGCPVGLGGEEGASGAERCEFSFVEGGPHLGDCALWAATTLRLAGVQLRAIAFEPLPDASALFQQSVAENGLAGSVLVRPAALGLGGGRTAEMVYYRGHNGQATVNYGDFPSMNPQEVVQIPVPEAALDDEVPATWPLVDALKLSVNGAERYTLAGARRLLSQRRVCSVLMHATKCLRGRRPASEDPAPTQPNASRFSFELMQYLQEGNLEVFEHDDNDAGPRRGAVRRLYSPLDMDSVFDDPALTEQVYFLAINRDRRCARAQRHFHAAAGRPEGSQLEYQGS